MKNNKNKTVKTTTLPQNGRFVTVTISNSRVGHADINGKITHQSKNYFNIKPRGDTDTIRFAKSSVARVVAG